MGSRRNEWLEWIQAIVVAVAIAFLIRTFLFEIIQVEGTSMLPTLHDRDRIAVNKLVYRISQPKHGDIVIFRNPDDPSVNYIKRVIGVEGDTVQVIKGSVIVNGIKQIEPYINEITERDFPETVVPPHTIFAMGDNRNHSRDSRDPRVGFVPLENMFGKAELRVWPIWDIRWFD